MSDDLVKQALEELQDLVRCRCHDAYKDRGLHDPTCCCDSAEAVKVVSDRIEELEAKLAKAVEALKFYAEADNYEDQHKPESCGCCYYLHDAEIKEDQGAKARTALAELTGDKDE